jgi:hypothetical protein
MAVVAVVIFFALVLQLVLTISGGVDANNGESGAGVPIGTRLLRSYSFFTVDSNIIVLVVAVMLVANPLRTGAVGKVVHLDALLSIVITGVVFSFVLAPGLQLTPAAEVVTVLFHYVSPWLFTLGWLLFGPRPQWSWRLLPFAFIWPVIWLGYTFLHGAITGWYPYPFLDARVLGAGTAIVNALVVVAVAVALAMIVRLVDRFAPAIGRVRTGPAS